jgi:hypothetical protein
VSRSGVWDRVWTLTTEYDSRLVHVVAILSAFVLGLAASFGVAVAWDLLLGGTGTIARVVVTVTRVLGAFLAYLFLSYVVNRVV